MTSEIVLSTNNELPHPTNNPNCWKGYECVKDLRKINTTVYMLSMIDNFDFKPFYKKFLCEIFGRNVKLVYF